MVSAVWPAGKGKGGIKGNGASWPVLARLSSWSGDCPVFDMILAYQPLLCMSGQFAGSFSAGLRSGKFM
jgi:hypothetical protein